MAMKVSPQIKAKTKSLIISTCGSETKFVQGVAKYISKNVNDKNVGMSIPKNVWAYFQDSAVFLDDEGEYKMLVKIGYSPNYLKKLGKYKSKTFPGSGNDGFWGTSNFFVDLIASVGTEMYLDYLKKHGGTIPKPRRK